MINTLIKQFIKFGIVGFINTINSWIIYYFLIFINVNYLISTTLAYFLSSIIGYMLNKKWVFKRNSDMEKSSIFKYYIVYISSYFLNLLCMYVLVDIINISDLFAPILVLFVTVPFNFIFSRIWVFKGKKYNKSKINKLKNKHTFVICAYKDSEYLEECIVSIMNQKIKTKCIIATSTPSKHIKDLSNKYKLKLYIKKGGSDIKDDWNFAYSCANTELVTIAHQDDIYHKEYIINILNNYKKDILMYYTNYNPYKNGKITKDTNNNIKSFINILNQYYFLTKFKIIRLIPLAFGNCINCPSVTYNKKLLGENIFTSDLKFALDWDTYLKIAKMKNPSLYIPIKLINYRIHKGATTMDFIKDNKRKYDDITMFNKMWPNRISMFLMKYYIRCYDTYKEEQ